MTPSFDRIRLRRVSLPLRFPFRSAHGEVTNRVVLIVVAESGDLSGYGEVSAFESPGYTAETIDGAADVIRHHLLPALARRAVSRPDEIAPALAVVRGHEMAKAGVEGALRDLFAKRAGVSLAASIGGTRTRVAAGVALGIEETDEVLIERARPFVEAGYQRVKVKIVPGAEAGAAALRRAFPDRAISVDANGAYEETDAARLDELDSLGLTMIEQPFAAGDFVRHAALAKRLRTPICLDESLVSADDARTAVALGAARVFNLKLGRVGGFAAAREILHIGRDAGIAQWCGGLLESCVGRLHAVAFASREELALPGDLGGTDRYFGVDLVDPPIRVDAGGWLAVPDRPGIGRDVDIDALAAHTKAELLLSPDGTPA